ncbi:MAG: hypothetical protein ACXV2C_00415 [Candidatus Bathyarchaeia archaeon]
MGTDSALRLVSPEYLTQQLYDEMRHVRMEPISVFDVDMADMPYDLQRTYTTLKRLIVEMKYHPNVDGYHIRVGFNDGKQTSMYYDPSYFDRVGVTPRDIDYIATQIAERIGNFINGSKKQTT